MRGINFHGSVSFPCVLLLFMTPLVFRATASSWQSSHGPEGGAILFLKESQGRYFAGARGGVYLSDGVESGWTPLHPLPDNATLSALDVSGDTIVAGSFSSGVFVSPDVGDSWRHVFPSGVSQDPPPTNVTPVTGIFCRDRTILFTSEFNALYHSEDFGATWDMNRFQFQADDFLVHDGLLYAFSPGSGLARSRDGGRSWEYLSPKLGANFIHDLCSIGDALVAVTNPMGIQLSRDSGSTWVTCNEGIEPRGDEKRISSVVSDNTIVYSVVETYDAGGAHDLYLSEDSCRSWNRVGSLPVVMRPEAVFLKDHTVWVKSFDGVLRYEINRGNWNPHSSGLYCRYISGLHVRDHVLRCSSHHGLLSQFDTRTGTWTDVLKLNTPFYNMTSHRDSVVVSAFGAIYCSPDGQSFDTIAVPVAVEDSPVLCSMFHGTYLFALAGGSLFRKPKRNDAWEDVGWGAVDRYGSFSMISHHDRLYTLFAGRLKYSDTMGETWDSLLTGHDLRSMCVHDSLVFVSSFDDGIYVSEDAGVSWLAPRDTLSAIHTIETDGVRTAAAGPRGDVFISFDSTRTWEKVTGRIIAPTTSPVQSFAFDGSLLYAGTRGSSVWVLDLADLQSHRSAPSLKKLPLNPLAASGVSRARFDIAGRRITADGQPLKHGGAIPQGVYVAGSGRGKGPGKSARLIHVLDVNKMPLPQ